MVLGREAHVDAPKSGRAVGTYAAFLARQRDGDGDGGEPSSLVDLLWHTHMQHPARYARDSVRPLAGRLIDHDDERSV